MSEILVLMTYAPQGRRALKSLFATIICVTIFSVCAVPAHASSSSSYRDRVHATNISTTGKGTVIGIFDGGINVDSPAFQGRIISQTCVGGSDEVNPCNGKPGREAHISCSTTDIGCFHGTAVAGFAGAKNNAVTLDGKIQDVSGVAPGASISYVRVAMTKSGTIQYSDFVEALQKFVNDVRSNSAAAPDVVNLSLSFPRSSYKNCNENNEAKRLIDELVSSGVVVVAATGNNSNKSEVTYPACMNNVIAVGSTGFDGIESVSDFSDSSSDVDLVAPGQSQWGMLPENMRFLSVSGTSFAAPLVSGAVALLKEAYPLLTPIQIKEILQSTGDKVLDPQTGNSYTKLNVENALARLAAPVTTSPTPQVTQVPVVAQQTEVQTDIENVISHNQKVTVRPEVATVGEMTTPAPSHAGTILIAVALVGIAGALCSIILYIFRTRRIHYAHERVIEIEWVSSSELSDFDQWEIDLLLTNARDDDPELVTD